MTARYLDYSAGKINGSTIRGAGFQGVVRYITAPNLLGAKHTNRDEYRSHVAAGLDVFLVYEGSTSDAAGGFASGVTNATRARDGASSIGYPANRPIFFCNDKTTVNVAQYREYLRGAAAVLGIERVGAYGFGNAMDAAVGHASYYWQAGRQADVRDQVHLYQWNNGNTNVNGITCDINYLYKAMTPSASVIPVPEFVGDDEMIMVCRGFDETKPQVDLYAIYSGGVLTGMSADDVASFKKSFWNGKELWITSDRMRELARKSELLTGKAVAA